jgi:hypothetical protein
VAALDVEGVAGLVDLLAVSEPADHAALEHIAPVWHGQRSSGRPVSNGAESTHVLLLSRETPEKGAVAGDPEVRNDLEAASQPSERLTTPRVCPVDEGIGLFQRSRVVLRMVEQIEPPGLSREEWVTESGRDLAAGFVTAFRDYDRQASKLMLDYLIYRDGHPPESFETLDDTYPPGTEVLHPPPGKVD